MRTPPHYGHGLLAAGPPVLHSRLVDDGRSLSPDMAFPRVPSSGLTSAFAVSPGKVPLPVGSFLSFSLPCLFAAVCVPLPRVLLQRAEGPRRGSAASECAGITW